MFTIYMPAEPSKKAVAACPRVHNSNNKIMKKSYKYFTNNSAIYMLCFLRENKTKMNMYPPNQLL